jgi:aconitate hydratase
VLLVPSIQIIRLKFVTYTEHSTIKENDTFNFIALADFAPDKQLTLELVHNDGSKENSLLNHTYNAPQVDWFRAGSALNLIRLANA